MGVQYTITSLYNITGNAYNSSAKTGSITQPTNGAGGKFTTHRLTNTTFIKKWSYAEAEFAITPQSSPDTYKNITIKYRYKYVNDVSGNWQNPTVKLGHKDASGNKIYGTYTHGGDKSLSSGSWSSWYTETLAPPLNSGQYRLIMHIQNNQDTSALKSVTVEIESITINYTPHTCNFSIETARTPSTCITQGSVTHKCSVSGCTKTQTTKLELDINNHTGGTEIRGAKPATCTEKGYKGDTYCKDCGIIISSGSIIDEIPHDYKSVVTPPTDELSGYTTHTCSSCGKSYKDSWICRIKVKANNDSYGTVTGSGDYATTDILTLTATPFEGYRFVKWDDGDTNAIRTDIIYINKTYTAIFEPIRVYADTSPSTGVLIDTEEPLSIYADYIKVYG